MIKPRMVSLLLWLGALNACHPELTPVRQRRPRSVPAIPDDMNLPDTNVLVVPAPDDPDVLYYRNIVLVAFDDTVEGSSIGGLLCRYRAEIIGGADFVGPKGGYVFRLPDPGPSLADVDSLVSRLQREPGVAEATWITYRNVPTLRGERGVKWPLLVDRLPDLDTSRVLALPHGSNRVFRTDISLTFKTNLSDSAKTIFLARHSMGVTGVTPAGRFFVRIPDPGPNPEALLQIIAKLREEHEVARVGWILRDPLPTVLDDR